MSEETFFNCHASCGQMSIRVHVWLDCILSHLRIGRPSLVTRARAVCESLPYASIAHLGSNPADCPILKAYYADRQLTGVSHKVSQVRSYFEVLRVSPQQGASPAKLPTRE